MDRIRAIILTTQRTGSTFLVDCLGSHPQIHCASEILAGAADEPIDKGPGRFRKLARWRDFVTSGALRPGHRMGRFYAGGATKVRVFKVMYNHLANPFALRWLQQNEDVRILHLRRYNLLKLYISKLLMPMRSRVQVFAPVAAVRTRVDPARAIASMRKTVQLYDRFDQLFERHRRLPLCYEDLFDGQFLRTETAALVCEFLEVERLPMKSRIVKLNPESIRDMIVNYDELAAVISRTEFADMLG
ncbi:MAG: hypothetical protein EPO25_04940 [Gammaproteobacteria bacterium]|nr:MAG: hypothetical protein EPO25_04940 [Gammaproteobacteria bacterium]